jgi:hypothetical protein
MVSISITTVSARPGPIHFGGFALFLVERLQRGQDNQRRKGQPLPGDDDDDAEKRHLREPVDGLKPEHPRQPGEEPVDRVHEHVLPDQRGNRGHHEKRGDHQQPHDALPEDRLVEQQREQCAPDQGDRQHPADKDQRIGQRRPEIGVGEEIAVIVEAGEILHPRHQKVVALEREPQRHRQRHDHPGEQQQHGRRHHEPRRGLCL